MKKLLEKIRMKREKKRKLKYCILKKETFLKYYLEAKKDNDENQMDHFANLIVSEDISIRELQEA